MRTVLFAAALSLIGGAASAHAILLTSDPAPGASVPPGLTHIVLHYNSRIDQGRSRLEVRPAGATPIVLKVLPAPPDALAADATLPPGALTPRWQVLAVDGHITRGDVPLTVQPAK